MHNNELFDFEKLDAYKKAVDFANWIYELTTNFPKSEQFGIVSQLRRAALSISLNIAEGAGRYGQKEKKQFYRMAKASIHECIPIAEVARQQRYIDNKNHALSKGSCIELAKIMSGLIKSVDRLKGK